MIKEEWDGSNQPTQRATKEGSRRAGMSDMDLE